MSEQIISEIIIDGKTVEIEGTILTEAALAPYRETAKHIRICKNVIGIGDRAFSCFKALESVEIPDSVTLIGRLAFLHCRILGSIAIPESVVSIGDCAFAGSDNIKIEIRSMKGFSKRSLSGFVGRPINIVYKGDEYPIMCYESSGGDKEMVVTGYVDYADGKIFSGYVLNGRLNPSTKELMYCYVLRKLNFHDSTLSGLKEWIDDII